MQRLIEDGIRGLGWIALKLVTLGHYRGGREQDRLSEGAVGLGIIVGSAALFYTLVGSD
jgi:hypothetical protein